MQRSCPRCAMHGLADEHHLVFEFVAVQPVGDMYSTLFGDHIITMKDFMWQADIFQVANFIQNCFAVLTSKFECPMRAVSVHRISPRRMERCNLLILLLLWGAGWSIPVKIPSPHIRNRCCYA